MIATALFELALGRNIYNVVGLIIFVIIALYQPLTGNYLRKAKSVLPPELESKRLAIARKHNQLVSLILLAFISVIFPVVFFLQRNFTIELLAVIGLGVTEAYGLFRVFKNDNQLCLQLGFMCPHCAKPLYDPHGFINVTGLCPKCRKSIVS
jgi:hypothetical protein